MLKWVLIGIVLVLVAAAVITVALCIEASDVNRTDDDQDTKYREVEDENT